MQNAVSQAESLPVKLRNNEDIKNLYYHSPAMCLKIVFKSLKEEVVTESAYHWSTRYL